MGIKAITRAWAKAKVDWKIECIGNDNNFNNYNRNGSGNNNNSWTYYYCGKEGHWKGNCYKRIREEKNKGQENGTTSMVTKEEDFANALAISAKLESYNSKWFIDSGCTY